MKVKELIEKLRVLDQERDIYVEVSPAEQYAGITEFAQFEANDGEKDFKAYAIVIEFLN